MMFAYLNVYMFKQPKTRKRVASAEMNTSATISPQDESSKLLYIVDSINHNVNIDDLEAATEAKAFSAVHDTESNVRNKLQSSLDQNSPKLSPLSSKKENIST